MYGEPRIQITPAIAKRLIDLIGVRLAVPVAPLPGEGLPDLIFRAAALNRVSGVSLIDHGKRTVSHAAIAVTQIDLAALADRLGCPVGIEDLKLMQYATANSWGGQWASFPLKPSSGYFSFFGSRLPVRQLISHRRVAPRSLSRSNHSKAIWHLKALTFDPTTHERLLDRCPSCKGLLDFRRPCGVSRCGECGPAVDLRDYPQEIAEVEDVEALHFVTSLIDPDRALNRTILHTDLRDINNGEIFMLCAFIAAVLDEVQHFSGRNLSISIGAVSPANLALAGRAVIDWPEGLSALEERLSQVRVFEIANPTQNPFVLALSRSRHFRETTISKVRKALESLVPRPSRKQGDESRKAEIHSRSYLLRLHKYAARSTEVGALSNALGIPRGALFECFLSGSVHCPDEGLRAAANLQTDTVFDYLNFAAPIGIPGNVRLRVRSVVSTLYRGAANPWPSILKGIQNGILPVVRAQLFSQSILENLQVEEFVPWIDFCRNLPSVSDGPEYPITRDEIFFYLDTGAVPSHDAERFASLTQLSAFRRTFACVKEIRDRLLMHGHPRTFREVELLLEGSELRRVDHRRFSLPRLGVEEFIERFLKNESDLNQKRSNC